jgi:hypothetical protein
MARTSSQVQLAFSQCLRWNQATTRFRPAHEVIDPDRHRVDVIPWKEARDFVVTHHYAHSMPATRFSCGLFEKNRFNSERLVGVACFSVPVNQATIPKWTGLPAEQGVELGRFVLLDQVPGNGESFFLARCFKLLHEHKPGIQAVVSFSDPLPRLSAEGDVVFPGHLGIIYQASNACYRGRTKANSLVLAMDGTSINRRTLCKLAGDERGAAGAYQQLRKHGAPKRKPGETPGKYIARALADGPFRRVRHPGNHTYVFPVGKKDHRRELHRFWGASLPYPKTLFPPMA